MVAGMCVSVCVSVHTHTHMLATLFAAKWIKHFITICIFTYIHVINVYLLLPIRIKVEVQPIPDSVLEQPGKGHRGGGVSGKGSGSGYSSLEEMAWLRKDSKPSPFSGRMDMVSTGKVVVSLAVLTGRLKNCSLHTRPSNVSTRIMSIFFSLLSLSFLCLNL